MHDIYYIGCNPGHFDCAMYARTGKFERPSSSVIKLHIEIKDLITSIQNKRTRLNEISSLFKEASAEQKDILKKESKTLKEAEKEELFQHDQKRDELNMILSALPNIPAGKRPGYPFSNWCWKQIHNETIKCMDIQEENFKNEENVKNLDPDNDLRDYIDMLLSLSKDILDELERHRQSHSIIDDFIGRYKHD